MGGWICNICVDRFKKGATMFGCRNCDYDLCIACNGKGVATIKESNCPGRHGLRGFTTPNNFFCDVCGSYWKAGMTMYGCRKCGYDLCRKCKGTKVGRKN